MSFSLSGQPFDISALMYLTFSQPGTGWTYDGYSGANLVLTYSFSTNASPQFRQIYQSALNELSKYLSVTFVQLADEPEFPTGATYQGQYGNDTSADLRFSQQSDTTRDGGLTQGLSVWDTDQDGDQNDIDVVVQTWTVNAFTILHEIGHALTLKHPSPQQDPSQAPYLPTQFQNNDYTVMHYYLENGQNSIQDPSKGEWLYNHFQMFDIYALQLRFGVNTSTSGNSVYTSSSLQLDQWMQVLWDSGGIDTLDMSDQTRTQRINLGAATFSNLGPIAGNSPSANNLSIAIGAVIENATGGSGNDTIFGNSADNILVGNGGDDILIGYDGNDVLNGGSGANSISGGAGNDTLIVSGNGSELQGGIGNDIYVVSGRTDTIIEYANEGTDEVRTTSFIYDLNSANNVEILTFTDNLAHAGVGNALANTLIAGTAADELHGRGGDDIIRGGSGSANTLLGGTGNDVYVVEASGDSVIEYANEGIDTVSTALSVFYLRDNVENLVYTGTGTFSGVGSADNNTMTAGAGADFLNGNDGNDILIGGSGADLMLGGNGADQFRYLGGETGYDRILDFASGSDKIALANSGFSHTTTIAFVSGAAASANSSNSTFLYDTNTGIISYDADGNGAGVAVQLAQLNTGLALSVGDFVFV